MKEKYVGKVKVPFCVDVSEFTKEDRNKFLKIYFELGYRVLHITTNVTYDGIEEDGYNNCWSRKSEFGENTTVYTLEELQAIIDSVDTHQPEVVSSEYVKWGDWQEGDKVVFCGFTNELHNHWSFTIGETYTVKEEDGFIAPMSDAGGVPQENWGFNFKKKSIETSDRWIPWSGHGFHPLDGDVEVKLRNGKEGDLHKINCKYFNWEVDGDECDIVAYRIVSDAITPPVASYSDDTATLDEEGYVGIASGETGSTDSVGSSVKITTNLSFNVMIKRQTFTLTSDELKELYTQLCVAEGTLQDWSIGE